MYHTYVQEVNEPKPTKDESTSSKKNGDVQTTSTAADRKADVRKGAVYDDSTDIDSKFGP